MIGMWPVRSSAFRRPIVSVDYRHVDVGDDEVGQRLHGFSKPFLPISRLRDDEALLA
jgi:hypothetical protein